MQCKKKHQASCPFIVGRGVTSPWDLAILQCDDTSSQGGKLACDISTKQNQSSSQPEGGTPCNVVTLAMHSASYIVLAILDSVLIWNRVLVTNPNRHTINSLTPSLRNLINFCLHSLFNAVVLFTLSHMCIASSKLRKPVEGYRPWPSSQDS